MISCDRAQKLFGPAWDDELSVAERESLESHFLTCDACRADYDGFARTLELVQGLPRPQVGEDFAERVLRDARARELVEGVRERRPAFLAYGGRLALAAGLVVAVGVGAFAFTHGFGPAGSPGPAPQVASAPVAPALPAAPPVAETPAPSSSNARGTTLGDPDAPVAENTTVASAGTAAGAARKATAHPTAAEGPYASALPDSLFDHSGDVEFVLDPVKMRRERGRGYTPVTGSVRGETASITF